MYIGTSSGLKRGAVMVAALLGATAQADYELYNANDTKLDVQLTVVGAQFGQDQPWWGEELSFLNVSANHWTEFGTEFGAKFDSKLWGGTLFGQASGIYTRSSGDDPSGLDRRLERRKRDDARAGQSRLENRGLVHRSRREHDFCAARPVRLFDRQRHDHQRRWFGRRRSRRLVPRHAQVVPERRPHQPRQQAAEGADLSPQEQPTARRHAR